VVTINPEEEGKKPKTNSSRPKIKLSGMLDKSNEKVKKKKPVNQKKPLSKEQNHFAVNYFVRLLKEKKIIYKEGKLFKVWEANRGPLKVPKRAERKAKNGYLMLRTTTEETGSICCMAHRVIYTYFNGPILAGLEINHINGKKDDNRIENLEMVTRSQNIRHAARTGLWEPLKGTDHPLGKLSDDDVRKIRRMSARGFTNAKLSKIFGVGPDQISRIVKFERRYWVW